MTGGDFLKDLVVIFAVSILIVMLFQRLRFPAVVGFILSGAVLGPHGLNLVEDAEQVEVIAEVGVVLLLFTLGLELSLSHLKEMRKTALSAGALQVGLTAGLTAAIVTLAGVPIQQGIFWGFLLALSSTAIVLKMLMDQDEVDTVHGRLTVGILVFQDLAIVPMMLVTPMLAGEVPGDLQAIALALAKAIGLVAGVLVASWWIVPRVLVIVVGTRSRELFLITIILICIGTAWLTSLLGLSLALGAFIAGLVISESEYSHQALAEIRPFRDSAISLFFIVIGMLLDVRLFVEMPLVILGLTVAVLVLKTFVMAGIGLALGFPARYSVLAGLSLAQVGEFSFVLAQGGQTGGLLSSQGYSVFLAISILTLILTPAMIRFAPGFASRLDRLPSIKKLFPVRREAELKPSQLRFRDHVIIAGYGLNGRNLARVLRESEIPFLVVELNGQAVRRGRGQGVPIYFGDVTREDVLRSLQIKDARVLVLALSDPFAARRAITSARLLNPTIHIIMRTRYVSEVDELLRSGANEVVPEEFETSLEIFGLVLAHFGVARPTIDRKQDEVRKEGYAILRRQIVQDHAFRADLPAEMEVERYQVNAGSALAGKTLAELGLRRRTNALIVTLLRAQKTFLNPPGSLAIEAEDILVLLGTRDDLQAAEDFLDGFSEDPSEKEISE